VRGRLGFGERRVAVSIVAFPPDNRTRDLDNILKALLDSLQHAGVIPDDNDVWGVAAYRHDPAPPHGHLTVYITRRGESCDENDQSRPRR
jgi:Holliday junction resolvase RusA-like endonuclease